MIEVENLTKRYYDVLAVDNISFEVGKGEVVGFLGDEKPSLQSPCQYERLGKARVIADVQECSAELVGAIEPPPGERLVDCEVHSLVGIERRRRAIVQESDREG